MTFNVGLIVELAVQGIINGAIYAMVAIGLAMVFGLLRILHIAHAGLFAVGGYLGVVVTNASGSFALALVAAMLVVGLLGVLIYRFCYEPILSKPPYVALIASVGLFLAMEEGLRLVFGDYGLTFTKPQLPGSFQMIATVRYAELAVVVMAIVLFTALALFAKHTRAGMAWRATVSEPAMASSFGVDLRRVRYLNFFIGSAFAAAAGVMVATLNNVVEPHMGAVPSYKALAIIVIGGFGNLQGTLIAALLLGIVESYGAVFLSAWLDRDSVAFAAMLAVLMLRPQGIFATAGGIKKGWRIGSLFKPASLKPSKRTAP